MKPTENQPQNAYTEAECTMERNQPDGAENSRNSEGHETKIVIHTAVVAERVPRTVVGRKSLSSASRVPGLGRVRWLGSFVAPFQSEAPPRSRRLLLK